MRGVGPLDGVPGGRPGGCEGWSGAPGGAAGGLGGWWGRRGWFREQARAWASVPCLHVRSRNRLVVRHGSVTSVTESTLSAPHRLAGIGGCVYTPEDSRRRAPLVCLRDPQSLKELRGCRLERLDCFRGERPVALPINPAQVRPGSPTLPTRSAKHRLGCQCFTLMRIATLSDFSVEGIGKEKRIQTDRVSLERG